MKWMRGHRYAHTLAIMISENSRETENSDNIKDRIEAMRKFDQDEGVSPAGRVRFTTAIEVYSRCPGVEKPQVALMWIQAFKPKARSQAFKEKIIGIEDVNMSNPEKTIITFSKLLNIAVDNYEFARVQAMATNDTAQLERLARLDSEQRGGDNKNERQMNKTINSNSTTNGKSAASTTNQPIEKVSLAPVGSGPSYNQSDKSNTFKRVERKPNGNNKFNKPNTNSNKKYTLIERQAWFAKKAADLEKQLREGSH